MIARYGFMEDPNLPEILALLGQQGISAETMSTSFFLSHETLIPSRSRAWRSGERTSSR